MRKKLRKSDIFDELKEKKQSPVIPIIIFLSIVTILSAIVILIFNAIVNNANIDLPWVNNKEEQKKPQTSSKDEMDLIIPSLPLDLNSLEILDAVVNFTKVTSDKNGYLITIELTSHSEYTTMEVKEVVLDGFYLTTKFAVSDRIDYDENGWEKSEQDPTIYEMRIKQTELDELGIIGFNEIKLFFDIENEKEKMLDSNYSIIAINDLNIVNERKGLIQIDSKNELILSYYKTVDADDATYIYFDFNNQNRDKDLKIYVKKLEINGKLYDLQDFGDKVYRQSRRALYLKIPKKDFSRVNTFNVSFFVTEETRAGKVEYAYITNEYSRSY